jgi:glycosyltransferase involved in cell wall biosynthesis
MRVLQVMSGAKVGGAERFFVDLVTALHGRGLDQRIVIRSDEARADRLRQAGLETLQMPFKRFADFSTRAQLKRCIEDFRPDIVQTWMSRASALCPRGAFIHVGWLGGYYDLKYFRQCDELVGVTRDLVNHAVAHGFPSARTSYLPTFASDAPSPPLRRADFDTPADVPLIMALGRLHSDKGFDVLLKALVDVPRAFLWLAGAGPLEQRLKTLARDLGLATRVRFLGWREDSAALYASCDICVMPSRIEPFGTVMIEAWAYRRPIIAAAAVGPRELIRNEENGLLTPIDDVASLTGAIRRLIEHPDFARGLVENARRAYEADYTQAKVVDRHLAFYERLLTKRDAGGRQAGAI